MSVVAFVWQQSYGLFRKKNPTQTFFIDFSTFESFFQKLGFLIWAELTELLK